MQNEVPTISEPVHWKYEMRRTDRNAMRTRRSLMRLPPLSCPDPLQPHRSQHPNF